MKRIFDRIVSLVLICATIASMFSGCSQRVINETAETAEIDTQAIAETILNQLIEETEPQNEGHVVSELVDIPTDWEDYVGDLETFVYGLLTHQLEYQYNVFPAYVELSDGMVVYGLAYSDYSECYADENETIAYFAAGFMPFFGENPIPESEFNDGLEIYNMDYEDEKYGFFMKYSSSEMKQHCVVYNQYLIYGVDENGCIFFENSPYERGFCDESLGSLYSYDEGRYVYDIDLGNYKTISGVSLSSEIDFDELERLVNECLQTQDTNFAQTDIVRNVYFAQEAVASYLLSLQEETFLGYDVDTLVELTNDLDPMECLRITPDGYQVIDITDAPENEAAPLVKWLVGSACVVITAVGLVGSVVVLTCPPLSAATSMVTGVAIDVFMQVVVSGYALTDVDWSKVALSAVTGAITGFLGPYITALSNGTLTFVADTMLDALMGGMEHTVAAWLDGESGQNMIKSFGYGFALGFGLSAGFKGIGLLAKGIASGIKKMVSPIAEKILPKLKSKVAAFSMNATKKFLRLKQTLDKKFSCDYVAGKLAWKQVNRIVSNGNDMLKVRSLRSLTQLDILDKSGNVISKETLEKLFDSAEDGAVLGVVKVGDEVVEVIKKNGIVSILFNESHQKIDVSRLVAHRETNFKKAVGILQADWLADSSHIPTAIKNAIDNSGTSLDKLSVSKLEQIIKDSGYVFHENADMRTITLITIELHDMIKHMGGYGLAKYIKSHMSTEFFERFLTAASSGLVTAVG